MLMKLPEKLLEMEAKVSEKQKQLLAANKAAARLLLLGIMSESRSEEKKVHNYNGSDKE